MAMNAPITARQIILDILARRGRGPDWHTGDTGLAVALREILDRLEHVEFLAGVERNTPTDDYVRDTETGD